MIRNHWTLRAVVAACTLAWLTAGQQATAGDRPLKLQAETTVTGDPFSTAGADLGITGKGTHLGNFTGTGAVAHRAFFGGQISIGSVRLTAANGDVLELSFLALWDRDTGIRTGPVFVNGGTGRFADAWGLAFITARPVRPGVVAFDIVGWIDY